MQSTLEAVKEEINQSLNSIREKTKDIDTTQMRNEPAIKAAIAEENKRKKELQTLEKSKAAPEVNLKDLQKFVMDQLNVFKSNVSSVDSNYSRLSNNDSQLAQVKLRL